MIKNYDNNEENNGEKEEDKDNSVEGNGRNMDSVQNTLNFGDLKWGIFYQNHVHSLLTDIQYCPFMHGPLNKEIPEKKD